MFHESKTARTARSELLARVGGEVAAFRVAVDPLERGEELAQVVRGQVGVLPRAAGLLEIAQRLLEAVPVDPVDDLAEHLHEAAIRVVGEARVAVALGEPFGRRVVEAEVEDRVHHPRHRDRSARADGDEQRVRRVAEALAGALLEPRHVLGNLVLEPVGKLVRRHVGAAGVGRDREPGRHGQPELRHLGEPDPLPAEQLAPPARRLVEVEDQPSHRRSVTTR